MFSVLCSLDPLPGLSDPFPASLDHVQANHGPAKPAILLLHPARFTNRVSEKGYDSVCISMTDSLRGRSPGNVD
jgi:hypothetical protein